MKKANYFTPVITAFDQQEQLDIQANRNIWEHLIQGGVSGLVIMGSIGEFYSLSPEEKKRIIDEAVLTVKKRVKVYIGTSCMTPGETIELSNYALRAGADAVMVISPYYFALPDACVESYYDQVADGIAGDLFLYNFPARTGYDLSPQVTLSLLRKHRNIIGYKDTLGDMGHTRELLMTVQEEFPDFMVLSGFDEFFAHNILSGGSGCIGGLSNIYPELFADWIKAADRRDMEEVSRIQRIVDHLMKIYSVGDVFVPVIKTAVKLRGVGMDDHCKKPFLHTTPQQAERIKEIMGQAEQMMRR